MFDYDGVIADSFEFFYDDFVESCREHGCMQVDSREAFLRLFDVNVFEGMRAVGIPDDKMALIPKTMDKKSARRRHDYSLYAGVPEVLRVLGVSHRLFIVTSNRGRAAAAFLDRHGIRNIEEILGSETETSKVRKIRGVLARYPGQVGYYVGDTRGDMLEGREAGAVTIAATWGWHPVEKLMEARPDHVVHHPRELLPLFARNF